MSKYETPEYHVILKESNFEIRKYEDFFIVEHDNNRNPSSRFNSLFSYISM